MPEKKDWKVIIPIVLAIILFVTFAIGCYCHWQHENESLWEVIGLFLPPLVLQAIGLYYLWSANKSPYYSFNLRATFISLFLCYLSWIFYSYFSTTKDYHKLAQQVCSIIILIGILGILVFVAIMTFAITRPRNATWRQSFCEDLNDGVKAHPFWALMFFITLFLSVAYLFGFVLAFHDQYARTKKNKAGAEMAALRMVNFDTIDDPTTSQENANSGPARNDGAGRPENNTGGNAQASAASSAPAQAAQHASADEDTKKEFCFYFNDIRAYLNKSLNVADCGAMAPPSRTQTHLIKPAEFNFCSLKSIVDELKPVIEKGDKVRVVLIGHASNEQPKEKDSAPKRYLSNFELSEARAQSVKYEILQLLPNTGKRRNIDWIIFPSADEPVGQVNHGALTTRTFNETELRNRFGTQKAIPEITTSDIERAFSPEEIDGKLSAEEKRVVIATLEPIPEDSVILRPGQLQDITQSQIDTLKTVADIWRDQQEHIRQSQARSMRLMDYMYFSIYTITTTGYGDIIPTTAYAKFVISLANFCEVLFLVVFFNALTSLKRRDD
jgi:outer membrane protein OmpA-like peptidoglycan-associated protein